MTDLATRIDGRLAEVHSNVQTLQSDIAALQARMQTLQSTLLLIFNLIALLATLVYIWVIYSQVVVIRHHWSRPASLAINPTTPDQSAPAVIERSALSLRARSKQGLGRCSLWEHRPSQLHPINWRKRARDVACNVCTATSVLLQRLSIASIVLPVGVTRAGGRDASPPGSTTR